MEIVALVRERELSADRWSTMAVIRMAEVQCQKIRRRRLRNGSDNARASFVPTVGCAHLLFAVHHV